MHLLDIYVDTIVKLYNICSLFIRNFDIAFNIIVSIAKYLRVHNFSWFYYYNY